MSLRLESNTRPRTQFWLSIWLSFMLLLVSILHTLDAHSVYYTPRNELVLIEFTLIFVVVLLGFGHLVLSFYYMINYNKPLLNRSLDCFFMTLSSLIMAIFMDVPTFF
jgi:hypothetical protein